MPAQYLQCSHVKEIIRSATIFLDVVITVLNHEDYRASYILHENELHCC
jgi:hypothetical protein